MSMRAILPRAIMLAETTGSAADGVLLPEEALALGQVSDTRRRQFTAGRICARRALADLGHPSTPILPGPDRAPLWPRGIIGSITHCDGYCAAAVAREGSFAAIGIDAEPDAALPEEVLERVTVPEERAWLRERPAALNWARLLFSAKESVFKAWFAMTGEWLDFTDACVAIDPECCCFRAEFLTGANTVVGGRYSLGGGLILTATTIAHAQATGPARKQAAS
jgi:4'-phosphopantetheinyl transferase EntD